MATPNSFDPLWVSCINQILSDRGCDERIMDIAPEMWDRFIGPMCDAIEDGEFDKVIVANGDSRIERPDAFALPITFIKDNFNPSPFQLLDANGMGVGSMHTQEGATAVALALNAGCVASDHLQVGDNYPPYGLPLERRDGASDVYVLDASEAVVARFATVTGADWLVAEANKHSLEAEGIHPDGDEPSDDYDGKVFKYD